MPDSMLHTWRLVEKRTPLYAQSFLPSDLLCRTCGLLQSSQRPTDVLMNHMDGLGQRHCATCVLTGFLLLPSPSGAPCSTSSLVTSFTPFQQPDFVSPS